MWANRSSRSPKMSEWANRSIFGANRYFAHFLAKNEWFTWKTDEGIPSPGFQELSSLNNYFFCLVYMVVGVVFKNYPQLYIDIPELTCVESSTWTLSWPVYRAAPEHWIDLCGEQHLNTELTCVESSTWTLSSESQQIQIICVKNIPIIYLLNVCGINHLCS